MSIRIREYIRQHHLALVALFVALSGTAYAVDGPLNGQNRVGSADIIDGEVTSADVANDTTANALTGTDVMANSLASSDVTGLGGVDIADGSLTNADVLNQSLTGTDIADNSINADDVFGLRGNDDIEDGSLGSADVANDSLTGADINEGQLNFGCRRGMIKGFALVKGSGAIPNEGYTSDPAYIDRVYNCSGGSVAVAESTAIDGTYQVRFDGVSIESAFVTLSGDSSNIGARDSDRDNFVQVRRVLNDLLYVDAVDEDGSPEHTWFYIVVM